MATTETQPRDDEELDLLALYDATGGPAGPVLDIHRAEDIANTDEESDSEQTTADEAHADHHEIEAQPADDAHDAPSGVAESIHDLRLAVSDAHARSRHCGDITWFHFDWSMSLEDASVAEYALSVANETEECCIGVTADPLYRFKGASLGLFYEESSKSMTPHAERFQEMAVLAVRKPRGTHSAGRCERTIIAYLRSIDNVAIKMKNKSAGGEHISRETEAIFIYIAYSFSSADAWH